MSTPPNEPYGPGGQQPPNQPQYGAQFPGGSSYPPPPNAPQNPPQYPPQYGQYGAQYPPPPPYGQYGPYPAVQSSGTNGLAIAGFVCAFLCSIVGLVLSIVGLNQAKSRGQRGQGLAIAGIVISLISIVGGIIVVAASH